MLDNLKDNLRSALKKIVGASDINEELINELCKDLQRALLSSDVNVKLVIEITKNLKERALKETPPKGLTKKDHIISILYGELSRLLGYSGESVKNIDKKRIDEKIINFHPDRQNTILMLGIQGSGKTTVVAKLARWLSKHGYRVGVIGADTWRPGALTQLKMNCSKINSIVYGEEENKNALEIVKNGLSFFKEEAIDIIIIDTAGRHKEEQSLLEEMRSMHSIVTPDHVFLIIDGTIGQQAVNHANIFHENAKISGIIITKLDGTAKVGVAIPDDPAKGQN
jgi:signal recognition particle subunit SRP54